MRCRAPLLPAFDAGIAGTRRIHVAFTIRPDGSTEDIEVNVEETPSARFYMVHTKVAVADWLFEPARSNGAAVSSRCMTLISVAVNRPF